MERTTLIALLSLWIALGSMAQGSKNFSVVDAETYRMYETGSWDSLIRMGDQAIKEGIDYYYLRMRIGIAHFAEGSYLFAAPHFKAAHAFNDLEQAPLEYMYLCYAYSGSHQLAAEIRSQLKEGPRERADSLASIKRTTLYLESGPMIHQTRAFLDKPDLDGQEDLYGEADYAVSGLYNSVLAGFTDYRKAGAILGFTYVQAEKRHLAYAGGENILDEPLQQRQFQAYLQVPLYFGNGIGLRPFAHLLRLSYDRTSINYEPETDTYLFTPVRHEFTDYLGGLNFFKNYGIIAGDLFGAYASFGDHTHYQIGGGILAYPLGHTGFYFQARMLDHHYENTHHLVFEQETGFRMFGQVWTSLYAILNPGKNYFHKEGYILYNTGDHIKLISGVKINWYLSDKLDLGFDYKNLWRQDMTLFYSAPSPFAPVTPTFNKYSFFSHILLLSLSWKI